MSQQPPVCVITGGTAGVGLAAALHFGALGYRVVICGRSRDALDAAAVQLAQTAPASLAIEADVSERASVATVLDATVARFGRIDVLVNNAGHAPCLPVTEMAVAEFTQTLGVNVHAVFHATQLVWPILRRQGGGVIVNISSLASLDPFRGFSVYGACKAWVNLFSKATADEGKPLGIRVYAVALGAVETRMLRGLFPAFPAEQTLQPAEAAAFIATLCGESMRHASGQTFQLRK